MNTTPALKRIAAGTLLSGVVAMGGFGLPQLSLPDVWAWGTPTAPCRLLPAKPAFGQLVRPLLGRVRAPERISRR